MPAELTGPRVRIRPGRASDAPDVFAYRADPDVARYQGWVPASVDEVRARWADTPPAPTPGQWWSGAIVVREGGALIGDVGVHVETGPGPQVELGVTLHPAHQGRGLATEAMQLLVAHVFETLGAHRVHCSVDPRNTACTMLLERLGFRREAHLVEAYWHRGAWVDDVIYARLRREHVGQRA